MTSLHVLSIRHGFGLRARQVKDLCTAVTSEILVLALLHGIIQLECDLSSPRTCLRVHREQMSQQFWRLVMSSTLHALSSKTCCHLGISPKAGKIT